MAPKMCEFSVATQQKIILLENFSIKLPRNSEKLNLNFSSIHCVILKKKENGSPINKPHPKKLDNRQSISISKESSNPFLSARELAVDVTLT